MYFHENCFHIFGNTKKDTDPACRLVVSRSRARSSSNTIVPFKFVDYIFSQRSLSLSLCLYPDLLVNRLSLPVAWPPTQRHLSLSVCIRAFSSAASLSACSLASSSATFLSSCSLASSSVASLSACSLASGSATAASLSASELASCSATFRAFTHSQQ